MILKKVAIFIGKQKQWIPIFGWAKGLDLQIYYDYESTADVFLKNLWKFSEVLFYIKDLEPIVEG